METLSDDDRAILKGKNFGHFVTLMPDGSPHSTPVWVDVGGSYVLVNTAPGRVKERNVRRDARVALSVAEAADPYRWLSIRGRVVETITEGAREHIDELSMRYNGKPYPMEGERVVFKIEPEHVARAAG